MKKYSFEEFKLFFETAEKTTEIRLATNKFNYSISITMLAGIALIWKWAAAVARTDYSYYCMGITLIFILSLFALWFSVYWFRFIIDYKNLNSAKFKVLESMVKNIYFADTDRRINIVSANPFEQEWEILKKRKHLQMNNKGELYLRANKAEKYLPLAFGLIFLLILCVALLIIILNHGLFFDNLNSLIHLKKA
jgi:hypothetical protein